MTEATLSAAELETLEAIAERLIPTDALGPGAVDAGAVAYIERALGGAYADRAERYRAGLAAVDVAAVRMHGDAFARLGAAGQDDVLAALEGSADASEREFFELVRGDILEGMFGDPSWGGNRDRAGWELIGYPGPRHVWTEDDQRLDVRPSPE